VFSARARSAIGLSLDEQSSKKGKNMKLKLVVIDLELSKRAKRVAAAVLVPVVVLAGGAIAYANVPHTWNDGDTLDATDLNGNFADHEGRISKLEGSAAANPSAFRAHVSATVMVPNQPTGLTPVVFDQVDYDLGAEYNPSTGIFKAKQAGVYMTTCAFSANNLPTTGGELMALAIYKNAGLGATGQVVATGDQVMNVPRKSLFTASTVQLAAGAQSHVLGPPARRYRRCEHSPCADSSRARITPHGPAIEPAHGAGARAHLFGSSARRHAARMARM
jgi:hypothetical protein